MSSLNPKWKQALMTAYQAATKDVDFLGTQETLGAFFEGASKDRRFRNDRLGRWYCDITVRGEPFTVPIELLLAGDVVDPVVSPQSFEGGFKASLPDLAIQKANSYQARSAQRDLRDFEAIIFLMTLRRQDFTGFTIDSEVRDALRETARECGAPARNALNNIL
ncbi:hypothetical protein TWF481_007849 [Arthrobotrys musiformis]|uniref:Uncharacterized protein n=1 Tax=Arthrobotrys musiformis TaxID=47236 RepID=A0AAV9W5D8_9PEZI